MIYPQNLTQLQKANFLSISLKTGKIDKKYGKLLAQLYDWRQKGDYENIYDYDEDSVKPLFEPVNEMIDIINQEIKK